MFADEIESLVVDEDQRCSQLAGCGEEHGTGYYCADTERNRISDDTRSGSATQ